MPRLFTGLELPEAVVGQLALARGGIVGARWLEPDDYHITLRFIGDIDNYIANEIAHTLFNVRRRPFEVSLQGLSSFGGNKPRAVVASIAPCRPLKELQAELERLMQRVGLDPEGRKYTPHVTLARVRGVAQTAVADYFAARGALLAEAFAADRFVLYSARDGSGGGPYVVEAAYPLG